MTPRQLERAVARATGEPATVIRRRGFSLVESFNSDFDFTTDECRPQVVDWDELAESRMSLYP